MSAHIRAGHRPTTWILALAMVLALGALTPGSAPAATGSDDPTCWLTQGPDKPDIPCVRKGEERPPNDAQASWDIRASLVRFWAVDNGMAYFVIRKGETQSHVVDANEPYLLRYKCNRSTLTYIDGHGEHSQHWIYVPCVTGLIHKIPTGTITPKLTGIVGPITKTVRIDMAIRRLDLGGCKWWNGSAVVNGQLTDGKCKPQYLRRVTKARDWSYRIPGTLPAGNYRAYIRIIDQDGKISPYKRDRTFRDFVITPVE